jgi:hypothetical protein
MPKAFLLLYDFMPYIFCSLFLFTIYGKIDSFFVCLRNTFYYIIIYDLCAFFTYTHIYTVYSYIMVAIDGIGIPGLGEEELGIDRLLFGVKRRRSECDEQEESDATGSLSRSQPLQHFE